MKILFIQNMNGISGSELYLMQLLPELKNYEIEPHMLVVYKKQTNKNEAFIKHLDDHGVQTHEIYGHAPLSPRLIHKLSSLIKTKDFQIVQTNLVHADLWAALVKIFYLKHLKIISVKHGYDQAYSAKYRDDLKGIQGNMFYWLQKYCDKFIDYNITISDGLYQIFVKGNITNPEKTSTIHYGMDYSKFEHIEYTRPTNYPYALILGRLEKMKGHELVIRAWEKVAQHNPTWKLSIVGGGGYEANLKALVQELNLESYVKFHGYQPNPHAYLHFANFTIVPSIFEGFGLILLESWLHKKAVICFKRPAMNEIIEHNKTGILVDAFNIDQLADKIISMFEDSNVAEMYGEAGYQQLNSYYTLPRMTRETVDVYLSVNK